MSKTIHSLLLCALLLGCETVPGRPDTGGSADATEFSSYAFQVPEDALLVRDAQLAEVMYQVGRSADQVFSPRVQVRIVVGTQADAAWLIAQLERGIADSRWPRGVLLPTQVQLSSAYPEVRVSGGLQ